MNWILTVLSLWAAISLGTSAGVPAASNWLGESIKHSVQNVIDRHQEGTLEEVKYGDSFETKLEAMGIDSRAIHPSILEDAKLLVVSFILIKCE